MIEAEARAEPIVLLTALCRNSDLVTAP